MTPRLPLATLISMFFLTLWVAPSLRAQDIYATVAPNAGGSNNFVDIQNKGTTRWHFYSSPSPAAARMSKMNSSLTLETPWGTAGSFAPDPGSHTQNRLFQNEYLRVYPKTLTTGTVITIPFSYGPASPTNNFYITVTSGVAVTSLNIIDPNPTSAASVRWRVTFASPVSGVTPSNFIFTNPAAITGVSIASVVADTAQPSTSWTITANTGTGNGLLGLNWAGHVTETPTVPNTFTGQQYDFQFAPVISQHPTNAGINRTTTRTLSVVASLRGGGTPNYQWYSGTSVNPGAATAIGGAIGPSYTPPVFNSVGTFQHFCRVSVGSYYTDSTTAITTVVNPPQITGQPANQTIYVGQTATLNVTATGTSLNYQWYRGTAPDTTIPVGTNSATYTSPVLSVDTAYWVRVTNAGPTIANSNTAVVAVLEVPTLIVTTGNDVVNDRDNLRSLRETIVQATVLGGAQTITFAPSLAGQTVTLNTGWNDASDLSALRVSSSITLQGLTSSPGVTIAMQAGVLKRHFQVEVSGSLTLAHLTLSGGTGNYGGAVWSIGNLTVRGCTFTGNTATLEGGAIQSWGDSPSLLIENCTFSGNTSQGIGGAIDAGALVMNLRHTTIVNNTATSGHAVVFWKNPATLVNSIIADNPNDGIGLTNGATLSAQSTHNLLGAGGTGGLIDQTNGNYTGVPASRLNLGPLENNGGPTPTIALFSGSIAVNAGTTVAGVTTDQRGLARSVGSAPDIGALEDSSGNSDPDGEGFTNLEEYLLGTDAMAIDSDNDGFNDATEILAGSNPVITGNVPPTTRIERVLGEGPARGLDLSGNFIHALNIGTTGAAGFAGTANFTADNAGGAMVSAWGNFTNWAPREFGAGAADTVLKTVFRSIRYGNRGEPNPALRTLKVALPNLVQDRKYKLQLLIGDTAAFNRAFDILVNGAMLIPQFQTGPAQGMTSGTYAGSAVVHEFSAPTSTLEIVLSGQNTPIEINGDPILNGLTLEEIPTPAAAPVISPGGTTHEGSVTVSMGTTAAGTSIYYTLDGSTPSASHGTLYSGPFTLVDSSTVRAISIGGGWLPSSVSNTDYTVLSSLQTWRSLQGLSADGSQDLANPSGDGIANLLKFAFNMAPVAGDLAASNLSILPETGSFGLPSIRTDNQGRLVIHFVRRKASTQPGISYTVESGDDLAALLPLSLIGATVESIDTVWERVTVTDPVVTSNRFGRLRVAAFTDYANDFATGPGAATLRGDAVWTDSAVKLTDENISGAVSAVVFEGIGTRSALNGFTARFRLALGPTAGGTPADGASFAAGNLGTAAWGEGGPGIAQSLAVGFDTFHNGFTEANIGIHVHVNGVHVAMQPVNPYTGGEFVPVEIRYDTTNGLTVIFDGATIFNNLPLSGFTFPEGGGFGIGARTGGERERTVVDDIEILPR